MDTTNHIDGNNAVIGFTANIVAAMAANTNMNITPEALPALISSTFEALSGLGQSPAEAAPALEELKPAVSVRASVKPEYIVCLEDGKKLTMLKRYLMTNFQMTPEQYRTKWSLPSDYPMVAPNYSEKRRDLAKQIGLGTTQRTRKPVNTKAEDIKADDGAPKRRGRKSNATKAAEAEAAANA